MKKKKLGLGKGGVQRCVGRRLRFRKYISKSGAVSKVFGSCRREEAKSKTANHHWEDVHPNKNHGPNHVGDNKPEQPQG